MAKPEEIIARAYNRVQARYQAAGAEVPPFDQLVREVRAELAAELDKRIRKAGRQLRAAAEVSAVIRRSPALRPVAAEHKLADLDLAALMAGNSPPKSMNGHGPRAGGPPRWHPESHRETEDD